MSEIHNLRLTVAVRVKAESSQEAYSRAEDAFKHMLKNKSYLRMLDELGIEFDAYSIAEVKKL